MMNRKDVLLMFDMYLIVLYIYMQCGFLLFKLKVTGNDIVGIILKIDQAPSNS